MNKNGYRRREILAIAAAAGLTGPALKAFAADAEEAVGRNLIGKLEGPEVVVDSAQWPKQFQEAPMLAARVAAGALPKLTDRIGADPLIIKPVHETGRFGGTWRQGFTGPGDVWNAWRAATGPDLLLAWDWTGNKLTPNIAKGWSVSDDGKITTVQLRRDMRWSDGHPFTADDFVFWYEDIYTNDQLVPVKSIFFQSNGQNGKLEKIDNYTIRLVFSAANYIMPDLLAGSNEMGGHSMQGRSGYGLYAPAHYMKQFHPKYVPEEKLADMAKSAGFPTWTRMFFTKNDWALNPDLPVVTPWITKTPINRPVFSLERNPYSIWLDSAGNQLPYIDNLQFTWARIWRSSTCARSPASTTGRRGTSSSPSCPCCSRTRRPATISSTSIRAHTARRCSSRSTTVMTGTRKSPSGSAPPISAGRCRWASTGRN